MLVREQLEMVRTMLVGSMPDPISLLDDPYTPGDPQITLRYAPSNVAAGQVVCAGLNTFYIWEVNSDGKTLTVMPSYDGGPDVALPASEIVRLTPQVTTWSMFAEWNRQVKALSSPYNGLYAYGTFGASPDYVNGTYELPTTGSWPSITPIRLVKAEYRPWGGDAFIPFNGARWQPDNGVIQVWGSQPEGDTLQFVMAFPFLEATTLDDDVEDLGLSQFTWDIPGLGVAAAVTRSHEARRVQPMVQGDPRRAAEVAPGNNLGVSRDFQAAWQARVTEELARQTALYGWRRPMPA